MATVNIGIAEVDRKAIAEGLSHLLADTYTLYLKTHNFHWNVTGPMFQPLHQMFEQEYQELAEAVDEIAERIRALGFVAPASYAEFGKLTEIKETIGVPAATDMIQLLIVGHETVVRTARKMLPVVEKASDEATIDLLTERMHIHEKNAWMLRSFVESQPNLQTVAFQV